MKTIEVKSAQDTMNLGERLASLLNPGDLVLLDGDLGAGKTTFTKGLANGLGIKRPIKSPTFTIIREYKEGRIPLYHMDIYRLENGGAEELGLDEYFNSDGINVIEWSKFIDDLLPDNYLRIIFNREDELDSEFRKITFEGSTPKMEAVANELIGD